MRIESTVTPAVEAMVTVTLPLSRVEELRHLMVQTYEQKTTQVERIRAWEWADSLTPIIREAKR